MPNSNLLDAQIQYESIGFFDLDGHINSLNTALAAYTVNPNNTNEKAIETAFSPIADYYSKLTSINAKLQDYLKKASTSLSQANTGEERYLNRVHPEEYVAARESTYGLIPELRIRSLPYILAASVFMALLSLFIIFQMLGFSGQINLPLFLSTLLTSPASPLPFYKNPLVLGGMSIILLISLVIFAVLYFKAKNTNNS